MQRFDSTKLRERRLAAGLTQRQLGYAVGRAELTIRDYERGPKRRKPYTPTIPVLLRIARVLDCNVEDFFTPVGAVDTGQDEQALPPHLSGSWADGDAREREARGGAA